MKFVYPLVLALTATTALAEASQEKLENCAATAGIVGWAVEMRSGGVAAAEAKKTLTTGDIAVKSKYTEAVGPLVDWVFSLPEAALSEDVTGAYEQQCIDYEG